MNTTSSLYGNKEVRVAAEEDLANYPRYEQPAHHGPVNTTVNTLDCMESDDDPVPVQEQPASGYHAVIDVKGSGLELKPVASFVLATDGTLVATDEDGDPVDEAEGFQGIICCEDPRQLRQDEVADMLNKTSIQEDQ